MNVSRRRYMGERGGSIPYQQVEYLKSTGTQYIKTNYIPELGDEFHVDFLLDDFSTTTHTLFCAGSGNSDIVFLVAYNSIPGGINGAYFRYFTQGSASQLSFYPSVKTWYSLDISALGLAEINNYTQTSSPQASLTGDDKTLWILERNNNQQPFLGEIGGFSVTNNGIKKLELIPVRVGQVGYMYDTVSGELFGNAGTGDFVLGPDVVELPYQEVEYLENIGDSYITTDYIPIIGDTIHVDYKNTVVPTGQTRMAVFWAGTDTYQIGLLRYDASVSYVDLFTSSALAFRVGMGTGHWFGFNMSGNIASMNTTSVTFSGQSALVNNTNMWLFRRRNDSQPHFGSIKCFWAERNGERIIDLVPIRIGTTGYMYDKVSGQLYGNSGTGDFILGDDVN